MLNGIPYYFQSVTSNGVKQEGCLSPSLFSVYLNKLIVNLRNSNIGCRYRSEYMGVFAYADELSLLCPSFSGIKEMLNICERFANNNNNTILFNASKGQVIYFSKNDDPMHVMRPILRMSHGQMVPYVKKCIHLGNTLRTSSTEHALIDSTITDLNIKTNNLLFEFSFSESTTLSRLFQLYCMTALVADIRKRIRIRIRIILFWI